MDNTTTRNSDIANRAQSLAQDAGRSLGRSTQQLAETAREWSDRAQEISEDSIAYMKENPGRTVLGAAALGFVAGFLLRGRH